MHPDGFFCFSAGKQRKQTGPALPHVLISSVLFEPETLLEAIHASTRVNQLLLARIERMTLGADIHPHFPHGGAGFEGLTASAANDAFTVLGMDSFLPCCFTSFAYAMAAKPQEVYYHNLPSIASFFYWISALFGAYLMNRGSTGF